MLENFGHDDTLQPLSTPLLGCGEAALALKFSELTMWTPYQKIRNRRPDFLVEYRFRTREEGGRIQVPLQGYRSDLHYDGEDLKIDGIYSVWSEFLDSSGNVILDETKPVPESGLAYMWILYFENMWNYHAKNAMPGRKCWFMEGSRKIADATILEQIALIHKIDLPAKKIKTV